MESQTPSLQPNPESPRSSWFLSHKVLYSVIGVLLLVVIVGSAWWQMAKQTTENLQQANQNQEVEEDVPGADAVIPYYNDWKTYTNTKYGFEFMYPKELELLEKNGTATLSHSIPYENYGDCDMSGGKTTYKELVDFKASFEISSQTVRPSYVDGSLKAGILDGVYAYQGAEGCGIIEYYFPVEGGTLIVKKDAVQALSGLTTTWNKEEILKVPGAITREESELTFEQILSTFKVIK